MTCGTSPTIRPISYTHYLAFFMLPLLIPYVSDENYKYKIYSHMILSILIICENFEKPMLIFFFLGGGGGQNLLGPVSFLLRVTSTFWTIVPFNWGNDSTF
jgi:hypothetical protein